MTVKNMVSNIGKASDDLVFIRMDTLIERLRRMRALNSTPANIGLTQYTWRSCTIDKSASSSRGR